MSTYYLQHHGVKGMKWGVRRYQNKDGTLTPAGKRRYDKMSGTKMHRELQRAYDKSKGGWLGKNYGENVVRVQQEHEAREGTIKKRLRSENAEYAALQEEFSKLKKRYDDAYYKSLDAEDKGDSRQAVKWSAECDRIEREGGIINNKIDAIEQREFKKVGMGIAARYAETSVAALMDLGFDRSTAKSFTDKMLKEAGKGVYL